MRVPCDAADFIGGAMRRVESFQRYLSLDAPAVGRDEMQVQKVINASPGLRGEDLKGMERKGREGGQDKKPLWDISSSFYEYLIS